MFKMRILITLLMLIVCTATDIKTGYINSRMVFFMTIAGVISDLLETIVKEGKSSLDTSSFIKIICILIIAVLLNRIMEKYSYSIFSLFGEGDLIMFISVGLVNGINSLLRILIVSFTFSGLYSIFLLVVKKKDKKYGFPFAPFILSGFIVDVFGNMVFHINGEI